ncbi:conserved hypothetical protein [Trichinella spiralis]|uniref:hypothetical protein n=1 Tax=Trichinella spiralis TaxID=6334 RepID=UPI0001EFD840|nr:conserved hypothetical protein [Trichinella spiralis]
MFRAYFNLLYTLLPTDLHALHELVFIDVEFVVELCIGRLVCSFLTNSVCLCLLFTTDEFDYSQLAPVEQFSTADELKDSKRLRRWILKKLRLEFNDLLSQFAVSKVLRDIRIVRLDIGSQFPLIKSAHVGHVQLSENEDYFEV